MTETNNKLGRLLELVFKAFILASVVAVILPMPQHALSLSDAAYFIWLVRLVWVLTLSIGFVVVLSLVGFMTRKRQNKTR